MTAREVIETIYGRFGQGDIAGLLSLLADDVRWTVHAPAPVPYGGTAQGRDAVAAWFARFGAAIEIRAFDVTRMVADGDTVVVIGVEKGIARPTGRAFTIGFAHVWTVAGGRAASFDDHLDSGVLVQAFAP